MRYPPPQLTKLCETCRTLVVRKTKVTYKQWATTRFCSQICAAKWKFKGERHPNWKGGKIIKACKRCFKSFAVGKYRISTALYCSKSCHYADNLGLSTQNEIVRHGLEMRVWRTHVFTRDDYTCQSCKQRGGQLVADHELPFSIFKDLRFEILNGRTFCKPCHLKTPTYGRRALTSQGF